MVLPPTYEASEELSVPATQPVTFGGFSDIFKGTLSGGSVCVKRLRIATTGDLVAIKRVTAFHIFGSIVKPLTSLLGTLQGGCGVETSRPREYRAI